MARQTKKFSIKSNPAEGQDGPTSGSPTFGHLSNAKARAGKFHPSGGYRGKNHPKNPAANWRRFNP